MTALVAVIAGLSVLASFPLVSGVLNRLDLVDLATSRSSHTSPTLRGGGLSLLVGGLVSVVVSDPISPTFVVLLVAFAVGLVGFLDDLHDLSPSTRLKAQLIAGLFVSAITWDAASERPPAIRALVCLFALVFVAVYTNAFNFMDGINGISAISAAITFGYYAHLASVVAIETELSLSAAALSGACVGFVPLNFPRAQVFLGDVGSYFLGSALAGFAVLLLAKGVNPIAVMVPLSYYCADVGFTLFRRAVRGERLTEAHNEHLYQIASRRFGHTATTVSIGVGTLALSALGLIFV